MASWSSATTSSPTTPSQEKPFVQVVRKAEARPFCSHGNEKVNPRGYSLCPTIRFSARMNSARHRAMWSNSWTPEPVIMDCGIKKTLDFTLISPESRFITSTRKFVPPRSSANTSPLSVPSGNERTNVGNIFMSATEWVDGSSPRCISCNMSAITFCRCSLESLNFPNRCSILN